MKALIQHSLYTDIPASNLAASSNIPMNLTYALANHQIPLQRRTTHSVLCSVQQKGTAAIWWPSPGKRMSNPQQMPKLNLHTARQSHSQAVYARQQHHAQIGRIWKKGMQKEVAQKINLMLMCKTKRQRVDTHFPRSSKI